ncbi:3-hydroxybutyrate dehydrogenase [Oleispirillum naphthae]|uniref:3-hydroxybutyrate dehydrogenase n=1 Tax=Oleispirillum naphthae TaxID=2838853 RepID=UPI00308227D9
MAITGRIAVVTGSTSGIGLGIAEALAAQGASVVLNGFGDPTAIEAIRTRIARTYGVDVAFNPADLSDPQQTRSMIADAETRFGRLDILVNNAGVQFVSPLEDFPTERWNTIIALNLSAVFHATAAALPGMKHRGFGRIVNIASTHGLVASPDKGAYVAAKHGVIGLTRVTALETAAHDITANAICPGWVLTPLVQAQIDALAEREKLTGEEARRRLLAEKQPSLDFATPAQIGELASFLCSDAATQIRGAAITIDGGWTAQ